MRIYKVILLLCLFGLFSVKSFSQSIGSPTVNNTPVCAGSSFNITFNVQNGNRNNEYFTTATNYTAYVGTVSNNTLIVEFTFDFQSKQSPESKNFRDIDITQSITVPDNATGRNNYVIGISSSNPNANTNTISISNQFTIKQKPVITSISNNGPICAGQTLNLSSNSNIGATYSWTGPNGYTSTQRNPSIDYVTATMGGTYTVVATLNGCSSNPVSTIVTINQPTQNYNEVEFGNDSWIGHIYDELNFSNYLDGYTENLNFDQQFGGDNINIQIGAGNCRPILNTQTFSVKYKMNSTLKGLYVANIGSDDGSRLTVDGNLIYNDWGDHAYRLNSNVLLNLTGSSSLILDYYENAGGNRINFGNLGLIIKNELITNLNQTLDSENSPLPISGDVFNTLPDGINKVNSSGYQWVYSTTAGGKTTDIVGATGPNYTPNRSDLPFNNAGTYYLYRKVLLSSSNNIIGGDYVTSNQSNAASVIVKDLCTSPPTINLLESKSICAGSIDITGTLTGVSPWTVNATVNGQAITRSFNESTFSIPITINQTTTINITKVTDGNSCENATPNESVTITVINGIQNNVITEDQEYCNTANATTLQGTDLGSGYTYTWEISKTSNSTGFFNAPGNYNSANYIPGIISETTWFRRKVNVMNCSDNISNVIKISIGNKIVGNQISFKNGNTDVNCFQINENQDLNLSSPEGTYYSYVNFASYGTATGTCDNYQTSNCHAINSQQIVESMLLGNSTTTLSANNSIFGDPCNGTYKSLTIQTTYSEPLCIGSDSGTIIGTLPSGGNGSFTYLWEVSTQGPNSGFTSASGINDKKNYNPGVIDSNSYYRRTVFSGNCNISVSPILLIKVRNENTWTGATSTNWNTASNWTCNTVPNINSNVTIPNGLSNYPLLESGAEGLCKDISIANSASLDVLNNTLNISGNIANDGNFLAENGTITLKGTSMQNIPSNTFDFNNVRNLIINNTSGATLNGSLEITGYVLAKTGNLTITDNLTLLSSEVQTALIDGSGSGNIIGTVILQRFLNTATGYKYFSSPFNSSTVGDFSSYVDLSASFPQVYSYDEGNKSDTKDITGWNAYTSAGAALSVLQGYAFNFGAGSSSALIELSGEVHNGPLSIQVGNSNGKYTQGYNLVGNPYPSPIDWNASGWTRTNIDESIYFFNAIDQYTGSYSSYVNNVSSTGSASPAIIPSMQGFFIHVSDQNDSNTVSSGTLGVNNTVRVNDFSQDFYKNSQPDPKSLIRITVALNGNSTKDAMVIYFDPFAYQEFDKDKDALKLMNIGEKIPNIYSLNQNKNKLSIKALPEIYKTSNERFPIGVKSGVNGELNIQLKDIENLPSNFNVYLIDAVKHIGQNLSKESTYKTTIKAGEYNSRFFLMFSESEITNTAIAFDEPFSITTINGKVLVKMNLKDKEKGVLKATTVTGQILDSKETKGDEIIELNGIKSSGIYFINLSWADQQYAKKIIIQK